MFYACPFVTQQCTILAIDLFSFVFVARRPGTIEQLKEAIRQEVAAIPPAMIRKAMDNFRERLQECVINNGRHLSDVIFKSVWKKIAS